MDKLCTVLWGLFSLYSPKVRLGLGENARKVQRYQKTQRVMEIWGDSGVNEPPNKMLSMRRDVLMEMAYLELQV